MASFGRLFLRSLCQRRSFSTTQVKLIDPNTVEEVQIPVPWGHIAGKWWGSKTHSPIVALHGYFDNSSSFDKLMPLLQTPSVLCIDLPGHGYSSHLPSGLCLEYIQYIVILRYVLKHYLKLKEVTFIGHSFGSSLCFSYAAMFPDDVKAMVNIDCSRLVASAVLDRSAEEIRVSIETALSSDTEQNSKGYSWEESLKYTYDFRKNLDMPLSSEACEIISKRGTKMMSSNLFRFSTDNRLQKFSAGCFPVSVNLALAQQIKCDVLNIIPKNGFSSLKILAPIHPVYKKHIKEMEKSLKKMLNVKVDGFHHVHLEAPENISSILNDFLKVPKNS